MLSFFSLFFFEEIVASNGWKLNIFSNKQFRFTFTALLLLFALLLLSTLERNSYIVSIVFAEIDESLYYEYTRCWHSIFSRFSIEDVVNSNFFKNFSLCRCFWKNQSTHFCVSMSHFFCEYFFTSCRRLQGFKTKSNCTGGKRYSTTFTFRSVTVFINQIVARKFIERQLCST